MGAWSFPYICQVITLFDRAEGLITPYAGQIGLNDTPDCCLGLCAHRTVREKHHRFFAEFFCHNEKQRMVMLEQFSGTDNRSGW